MNMIWKNTPPTFDSQYIVLLNPSYGKASQTGFGSVAPYTAMTVRAKDAKHADWSACYWCYITEIAEAISAANNPVVQNTSQKCEEKLAAVGVLVKETASLVKRTEDLISEK